jgi:hypothetical protein
MRVQAFLIFLPLLLAGCSAPNGEGDVPGTDAEKEVILGVVHDLFQALEAREPFRLQVVLHENAVLTRIDARGDTLKMATTSGADWISSVSEPGEPLIERMEHPEVHHSGRFADVWTFYDFHVGDKLSHCGYDAIQLVKESGQWRILEITYTIESCP